MNVEVENTDGTIRLPNVNGRHELGTTYGKIEVAGWGGSLDASTTNGSIKAGIPLATTSLERNSLRGTMNGGGVAVRMRTTNGGIAIRAAGKS